MKIIRTKVMPIRTDKGGPVKIKATDDATKEAYTSEFHVTAGVTSAHHIHAAKVLCRIKGWVGLSFAGEAIKGRTEMRHIEQVNTWVS
jgi:hypothetical protein